MNFDGVELLPSDLICCSGSTWVARAIKWFSREHGEELTYAHHIAGVGYFGATVLEELGHLTETDLELWMCTHDYYEVWRYLPLAPFERRLIANFVRKHVGVPYAGWKIALHAIDGLIGKALCKPRPVYLTRRIMFLEHVNICSSRWACAYEDALNKPGLWPVSGKWIDPDEMHDHFKSSSDWTLIYKKGI